MARAFDDASSQALTNASAVLAGTPLTIAGWFNSDDLTVQQCLASLGDTAGTSNWFALLMDGTTAGDPLLAIMRSGGTFAYATSLVGYSANTWMHAAAVFASTTSRSIYIDGANKVTNTASLADPFGIDATAIGRRAMSAPDSYMSGKLAEVGIWNVALDDSEIAALAKGFSPKLIRPSALVAYWPLYGNTSPELDYGRGQFPLTLTNTPTKASDHPRTYMPTSPKIGKNITFNGTRIVSAVPIEVVVGAPTLDITRVVSPVGILVGANNARPAVLPDDYYGFEVGGAWRELDTNPESVGITEALNNEPDTAQFTLRGIRPFAGQPVRITHGDDVLFGGVIKRVSKTYLGLRRELVAYAVSCDDYTWLLNGRLVSAKFTSTSASEIVTSLISAYTDGFTTVNVVADLDELDEITFTDELLSNCLTRIAQRIGGYWYIDPDRDVHFFITEVDNAPDPINEDQHRIESIDLEEDSSQVRNRVIVEGGGSTCPVAVPPGSTVLPMEDPSWYLAEGGLVKVGPQHVAYTGVDEGGGGSIVGAGVAAPSNAPSVAEHSGAGLSEGTYAGWKVSFGTAGGETLCGPASASLQLVARENPTLALTDYGFILSGAVTPSLGQTPYHEQFSTYKYVWTLYASGAGETMASPLLSMTTPARSGPYGLSNGIYYMYYSPFFRRPVAPPSGVSIRVYRTVAGGSTYYLVPQGGGGSYFDSNGFFYDICKDSELDTGTSPPGSNTLNSRQVSLSSLPISPSGSVNKRKIYRPVVGGSTYKLVATVNDNTTTSYVDAIADGSLGANEPASDTSGLTAADGQVNAGSPTIPVSSGTPFITTGGYVRLGSQVVYYGGKTATSLTNIPTEGPGSLVSTVQYGTSAIVVATLTGVPASGEGAIAYAVALGEDVNVLAVADDFLAQATLAAHEGGDGVHEHFIQDRRLSAVTAAARANAELVLFANPIRTVRYTTRDRKTRAGKTILIELGHPNYIIGDFTIQRVSRSQFGLPGTAPLCSAEAATVKFSLEDVLRRSLSNSD